MRPAGAKDFLDRNGLGSWPSVIGSYQSIGIRVTPTILLLDPNQKVLRVWVGQLDRLSENSVLDSLRAR